MSLRDVAFPLFHALFGEFLALRQLLECELVFFGAVTGEGVLRLCGVLFLYLLMFAAKAVPDALYSGSEAGLALLVLVEQS